MRTLAKLLLLPPGSAFVLALIGLALLRRRPRTGRTLIALAGIGLYVQSTPLVATLALASLEAHPPIDPAAARAVDAIVVLGGDQRRPAPELGSSAETVGELSLERLRYAAHLWRTTQRPLCVTGGRLKHGSRPIALTMANVLERELGAEVRWVEERAATTWENATRTRALLLPLGLERIALVTHAWHMPRAEAAFATVGFDVVPAPTVFRPPVRFELVELLPSAQALYETSLAWHEWIGRAWYALAHSEPD